MHDIEEKCDENPTDAHAIRPHLIGHEKKSKTHPGKLVKDALVNAALFEVDSGGIDDISNDLLVDVADIWVRHLGGDRSTMIICSSRVETIESSQISCLELGRICLSDTERWSGG